MEILIIDDEDEVRNELEETLESEGHYVEAVRNLESALLALREHKFDLIILDFQIAVQGDFKLLDDFSALNSQQLVVISSRDTTIGIARKVSQEGVFDYVSSPYVKGEVYELLAKVKNELSNNSKLQEMRKRVGRLDLKDDASESVFPVMYESGDVASAQVLKILFRAAPSEASILIMGESGTGKSVVAKKIHEKSKLSAKKFVTISCPSLSVDLLESELFGYVKGSFTGATKDTWGKVAEADGGTLFLDEVGELPMAIQPKLLRLLQEREYERVGETKTRKANVRIIAATNKDLQKNVVNHTFREDLFYRLNVITVTMPSLKDRPNDLLVFTRHYLRFFSMKVNRPQMKLSELAMEAIMRWEWPGNLRELRNTIERVTILSEKDEIYCSDLPFMDGVSEKKGSPIVSAGDLISIEDLEKFHIQKVMEKTNTLTEAAKVLGIDKATLYRKRVKLAML